MFAAATSLCICIYAAAILSALRECTVLTTKSVLSAPRCRHVLRKLRHRLQKDDEKQNEEGTLGEESSENDETLKIVVQGKEEPVMATTEDAVSYVACTFLQPMPDLIENSLCRFAYIKRL